MNTTVGLPSKVLFIDDDVSVFNALKSQLLKSKIELIKASDLSTALYLFNHQKFKVAIVELEFSELSGVAIIQKFRNHPNIERRSIGIILSSGLQKTITDNSLVQELGDIEFIEKPINPIKLLSVISKGLENYFNMLKFEEIKSEALSIWAQFQDINKAIEHVLDKQGLTPKTLEFICDILEDYEDYNIANNFIDAYLEKYPNNINLINAKGKFLLKEGKLQEAKIFFEKADSMAPNNIQRLNMMKDMYLGLKEPEKASKTMKSLIYLNPENEELRFEFFKTLNAHGYQSHAISLCRDTTSYKEVVRYYNNKGVLYSKEGNPQKALEEYELALKFYPQFKDNYKIYFNIAIAEANKKTLDGLLRAEKALEQCLVLMPDFDKAKELLNTVQKNKQMLLKEQTFSST